ncbi:hypothetical protein EDF73_11216 [Raoultella sp. BIGb0138]|nr:hypothetical protein EDF73_11216 [Raoultella sp. BIGb0138]
MPITYISEKIMHCVVVGHVFNHAGGRGQSRFPDIPAQVTLAPVRAIFRIAATFEFNFPAADTTCI